MSKVSVIIATHSRPHLLPRAIESARQAGKEVEVIVVDDASSDSTSAVCKNFKDIHYIRVEANQGVAGARNLGILASTSEYISFLDDDDIRLPGSLDRQIELLGKNPDAGLAYGRVVFADENYDLLDRIEPAICPTGDIFWELLSWGFIFCPSVVFRKNCLFRIGLVEKNAATYDDWDLWVRIAEHFPVVAVNDPAAVWRMATPFSGQGSSSSSEHLSRIARHQLRLLQLPRALSASPSQRREARKRFLDSASDWLIWEASAWLPKGAYRYARSNIITALRLNPFRACRPWTFRLLFSSFHKTSEDSSRGNPSNRAQTIATNDFQVTNQVK